MSAVRELLAGALRGAGAVAVLGAGSPLLGDDGAGTAVAEGLLARPGAPAAFAGGTAPENFTGEIKRLSPELLLVVDAADMGLPPGSVGLLSAEEAGGASFSTHMLPLKVMLAYLAREVGCRVAVLGIQPERLEFGAGLSPAVRRAVDEIVSAVAAGAL